LTVSPRRLQAESDASAREIRQSSDGVRPSPILTVVVPTFNESANVPVLALSTINPCSLALPKIADTAALACFSSMATARAASSSAVRPSTVIEWELVFVDDNSPDATSAVAKELGRHDSRVRCIRRVGRRGLSGACLEGALSSQAEFVAVMDADLQHDERIFSVTILLAASAEREPTTGGS
jgi:cellulose synthase/poly-beta-1,6-N-acetylglucosamine synthase-like glycosyltransferase